MGMSEAGNSASLSIGFGTPSLSLASHLYLCSEASTLVTSEKIKAVLADLKSIQQQPGFSTRIDYETVEKTKREFYFGLKQELVEVLDMIRSCRWYLRRFLEL